VLIGSELAASTHGVLLKLLAFPGFIAAVAMCRLLRAASERKRWPPAPVPAPLAARRLLASCYALRVACRADRRRQRAVVIATGMLAPPPPMPGCRTLPRGWPSATSTPTTVMTGNVTQLVIDLVDLLRAGCIAAPSYPQAPVADPRLCRRRDPVPSPTWHAGSGLSPCHWPS